MVMTSKRRKPPGFVLKNQVGTLVGSTLLWQPLPHARSVLSAWRWPKADGKTHCTAPRAEESMKQHSPSAYVHQPPLIPIVVENSPTYTKSAKWLTCVFLQFYSYFIINYQELPSSSFKLLLN